MESIKTYLPLFSGFYNTVWDDPNQCLDDLTQDQCDKYFSSDLYTRDWKEYQKEVTHACVEWVEKQLIDKGFVDSIKFEKLVSPKYYNYGNDEVNVIVKLKKVHIDHIKHYLSDTVSAFQVYLNERYTDRDGFWSSHSTDVMDWVDNMTTDTHKMGAILEFILQNEGIKEIDMYYHVSENVYIAEPSEADIESL